MWEGMHRRSLCAHWTKLNRSHRLRRYSRLFLAASVVCLKFTCGAFGADDTWTSGSGIWTSTDNADWSLGHPPAAGDNADIINSDSTSRGIAYAYTGPVIALNTLTVANFGSGTNLLSINEPGTVLSCQTENVASADSRNGSNGEIDQYESTNDISGSLNIGIYQSDSGLYALTGGTLAITTSSGLEAVGNGGTLYQSGGLNTLTGTSVLQVGGGGGIYSLSGSGSLSTGYTEYIGYSGYGTFIQTGGANSAATIYVGNGVNSNGTYSLSGTGTLSAYVFEGGGGETIGGSSPGTFVQMGGTNSLSGNARLDLGYNAGISGYYTLSGSGSTLIVQDQSEYIGASGSGTFIQSGGTNTVSNIALLLAYSAGSSGYYSLTGSGSTLQVSTDEDLGYAGTGTFIQSGGTNTAGGSMYLGASTGASGIYSLSGTGSLSVTGDENIGDSASIQSPGATGVFTQSGGINDLAGTLYIGSYAYDQGTYDLQGGTLAITSSSGNEHIGNGGTATFNQTGGLNTLAAGASLYIASFGGNGTYSLSGSGSLTSGDNEYVGYSANGTFVQSGGTNTNTAGSAWLYLGYSVGYTGNYSLSSGTVLTSAMSVGYNGTGTFHQSGGTLTASSFINVADQANSSGSYTLSNGSLTTPYLAVAAGASSQGTFTQGGGTVSVTSNLYVAGGSGSTGIYSLTGPGAFTTCGNAYVGGNASGPGGAGTLTIDAGRITVSGTLKVWNSSGTQVTNDSSLSAGNTVNLATINVPAGSANLGAVTGTGTLNVGGLPGGPGGPSVTASGLQQSSVTIVSDGELILTAGGATNAVNSLVINSGGVFNLTSTKLLINYGGGSDPITTIAGYIKSGYNGGHWNGPGIISTTAQTPTNGLYYGVGYADGEDKVVAGLTSGQIEVKYTLLGDANLDGLVNGSDFNILAANFNQSITGWDQGDFNYDGLVNASDFNELAANFNQGDSGTTTAGDVAALDAFAAANGLSLPTSNVPEPGFTSLAGFAAAILWRRSRRRG
jgi:hypothetical protein